VSETIAIRTAGEASLPPIRNLIVITLDSCRHDSWLAAEPATLARLGPVERRWSYASWTAPSHYNLLSGLMPHSSPPGVFASEYYKEDYLRYRERLDIDDVSFKEFLPSIWLPAFLKQHGYRTHAFVSLPVLNSTTGINRGFDTFELMESHNDMAGMVDRMSFEDPRPAFYLLNVGETHYPYALPGDDPSEWPRVSGVHGVLKRLDDLTPWGDFFDQAQLDDLRARQIRAVEYLDREVFPRLFELLPADTWVVVTADHGELFGEDGYFGHGPIHHPKVFEVPFVEGLVAGRG
jgi:arylsulfatase A-like enzyme